jgi:hypothetical protein
MILLRAARPPGLVKHLGDMVGLYGCGDSFDVFTSELICRDVNLSQTLSPSPRTSHKRHLT